jgi:hypothetical protein
MEAAVAPHKEVCKDIKKKAKESQTILHELISRSTIHPVIIAFRQQHRHH